MDHRVHVVSHRVAAEDVQEELAGGPIRAVDRLALHAYDGEAALGHVPFARGGGGDHQSVRGEAAAAVAGAEGRVRRDGRADNPREA